MKRLTNNEIDARALEAYDKGYQAGRKQLLDQIEKEVIGEDRHSSKYCDEKSCVCTEKYKNELRAEQRIKLSALRKEVLK